MNQLLTYELLGVLVVLLCLPSWLAAWRYASQGDKYAYKRLLIIIPVLLAVGASLLAAASALELRHLQTLLICAFMVLSAIGVLVSASLHRLDGP